MDDDAWLDGRIIIRERQDEARRGPCPWCGCPQASQMLVSVLCANPQCRWHDGGWAADLMSDARETVSRWLRSRQGNAPAW